MIKIENLHKRYKKLTALDNFSAEIQQGKATIIVGPNGSGKSTLIKCILGLVKPTSGTIKVADYIVNGQFDYRKEIGYIPQYGHFPDNLSVKDVVSLVRNIRNGSSSEQLIEDTPFNMRAELNKKIYTLSGGTRQKLSANLAFMFDPKIYICDEATAGLDPSASRIFKERIRDLKKNGKTILLTSHVMSEVEELADEIIFICEGKIQFNGSVAKLKSDTGESNLENSVAKLMDDSL